MKYTEECLRGAIYSLNHARAYLSDEQHWYHRPRARFIAAGNAIREMRPLGSLCLRTAIRNVVAQKAAEDVLEEITGDRCLAFYNDQPGRTLRDVQRVVEMARAKLEVLLPQALEVAFA